MKAKSEGMVRAFLVMTNDRTLNMKDNSVRNSATVHTVLVGPKDKVEVVEAECKKHNEGPWQNRSQVIP